jgi:hypothetical protein
MTTATNTPAQQTITKEQFVSALAARIVKGDTAAIAILSDPKATALGFAEFLQTAATSRKVTLSTILSQVAPDSLEWLTKTIPKGPQADAIKAAILASRASLPVTLTLWPAGAKYYKSRNEHNTMNLLELTGYDADGKKQNECHGVRFWRLILALIDDPAAVKQLRDSIPQL